MTRIDAKFAQLHAAGKKAFVSYIMAGDPDYDTAMQVLLGLPAAGVDIIELGLLRTKGLLHGVFDYCGILSRFQRDATKEILQTIASFGGGFDRNTDATVT